MAQEVVGLADRITRPTAGVGEVVGGEMQPGVRGTPLVPVIPGVLIQLPSVALAITKSMPARLTRGQRTDPCQCETSMPWRTTDGACRPLACRSPAARASPGVSIGWTADAAVPRRGAVDRARRRRTPMRRRGRPRWPPGRRDDDAGTHAAHGGRDDRFSDISLTRSKACWVSQGWFLNAPRAAIAPWC